AADQDVAALAAPEDVRGVVADEDVVAGAAADVLDVAHAAGHVGGGAQRQVDADVGGVEEVRERVGAGPAIDGHRRAVAPAGVDLEEVVAQAAQDGDLRLRGGAGHVDQVVAAARVQHQVLDGAVVQQPDRVGDAVAHGRVRDLVDVRGGAQLVVQRDG